MSIGRYIYRPMHTPFLPFLRPFLAPPRPRPRALRKICCYTLSQLEDHFSRWMPQQFLPKNAEKANSRDRVYTRQLTFWSMLWQCFHAAAPCREVVRQIQALLLLKDGPFISEEDGAYCSAKQRLPLSELFRALTATADAAERLAPSLPACFQGRRLRAVDGSALTLADTPNNRQTYPPLCPQIASFPMMRIVVLFCMASGAVAAMAQGSLWVSELSLVACLMSQLAEGDILVGDRGFGCYPLIGLLKSHGVDFIGRTTRRVDGRRRLKRLAANDWLIRWQKTASSSAPWLTAHQREALSSEMTLRVVKGRCYCRGFRVRELTVVTTLLDAKLHPAEDILRAYLWRWRLEMCLDDLKTTLQMEMLRGRTPDMVQKEVCMRLIAHNLIRCVMAEAADKHNVDLGRISFKGSLDALRQFSQAMARCGTKKKRQQLWEELLRTIAADLVPQRPGRREPRAVKRKKNKYPRLNVPRHKFRDHPKRNLRAKLARLRRLGLK